MECGATKTVALLEREGEALRGEFGPANLRLMDDRALTGIFDEVRQGLDATELDGLCIAMAGARNASDRKRIAKAAESVWPGVRCQAINDLEPALLAAPAPRKAAARILVLSGTGSCCFGRTTRGKTAKVGGWGHILGDRGSGYEIALNAVKVSICAFDKDGKWPVLGQRLLRALQLNEPDDLIDWVRGAGKAEAGNLAIEVFAAAAKGDHLARGVLDRALDSLAQDAEDCARRLVKKTQRVQFVLAGSVLVKQPAFARELKGRLLKRWPAAEAVALEKEAVWGALELARGGAADRPELRTAAVTLAPLAKSRELSPTERRNPRSVTLDELSFDKAVALMLDEETSIGPALKKVQPEITHALKLIAGALQSGGRLFYVGAGTSGRLGVLDASECPPTFRASPEQVQGIIAGGQTALWSAVEGKEDDPKAGAAAVHYRGVRRSDVLMGIAASGRTPFVWGALAEARRIGARTILLCFNPYLEIPGELRPDVVIAADVGPEILTGSTRLKSGTATKVVLNTLTTLSMVRLGKVMSNLMVDVNPSNEKLRERAVRIVTAVTDAGCAEAKAALEETRWVVKDACQKLRDVAAAKRP